MKYKKTKLIILSIILILNLFILLNSQTVRADTPESMTNLQTFAEDDVGMEANRNPLEITISIINIVLAFVGLIFLIMVIYSGIQWMTSGGNEEKIAGARKKLINSAIGVLIILCSYIISNWIMATIQGSANQAANNWLQ